MVIARPGAVDHAADRAVELDEGEPRLARGAVLGRLVVEVAQVLETGVPFERRVVERHLRVEADQPFDRRPVGSGLAHDRQRVDLDQVGVVGAHRGDDPLRDRDAWRLRCAPRPIGNASVARLQVEQPEQRVGVASDDGLGMVDRDLLDLDPAFGGAHQEDPALGAVEHRGEVELLDDVGGRRDEHLADGHALDGHAEDRRCDARGLVDRAGELDATRLAAPADEDLRLDDDRVAALVEEALRGGPDVVDGMRDLPRRDGQPLREQQGLGVGFLDLHGRATASGGWSGREGDGTASDRDGRVEGRADRTAGTAPVAGRRPARRVVTIGPWPTESP